ncbi:MAG: FkbM family methyltransferase [Cytophagales bacterium]|nr:FkbM family methyltransferase [Cytophagales bacterium]
MVVSILRRSKALLWRKMASLMRLKYKLPSGVYLKVDSYSDWCTIGDIFMNGEYDLAIDFALNISDNNSQFVFFDLGANVGFFTQRLLHKSNLIGLKLSNFNGLLVEATPSLRQELETRLNSWISLGANLKIVSAAAGKRSGYAEMNAGRAHSRNFLSMGGTKGSWRVPFMDLESDELGRGKIDLIKCDIEGAELFFLEEYGDMLGRCKVFVIECHPPMCDEKLARTKLESYGLKYEGKLRNDPEGITIWFSNPSYNK